MGRSSANVEVRDFERSLRGLGKPAGHQAQFLRAHAKANGRALNMNSIARAAKYANYWGANLQYGRLARRIGSALGRSGVGLGLLVDFVPPKGRSAEHISNDEWILVMKESFAKALKRSGWI